MDNIIELRDEVARINREKKKIAAIRRRRDELQNQKQQLLESMNKEQADVDKIEKVSIQSAILSMLGKREERLDKEKREAYEALTKYQTTASVLESVEDTIQRMEADIRRLPELEKQYNRAFAEKERLVKESNSESAEKIMELEKKKDFLEGQIKELDEAIKAGRAVIRCTTNIQNNLSDAKEFATWDVIGGGLLADINKYSSMNKAEDGIGYLQILLGRFKTELMDISISRNFYLHNSDTLKFADMFINNLYADLAVLDKIITSQGQVTCTEDEVIKALDELKDIRQKIADESDEIKEEINAIVIH